MKKVLKVLLPVLLVGLLVAYTLCYCIIPEQTLQFVETVKDFINQPLPIAGFTTLTVGGLLFLIIRFIINNSNYGKQKLAEYKTELDDAKQTIELEKEKNIIVQGIYKEQLDIYKYFFLRGLSLIPNKKVQDYVVLIEEKDSEFNRKLKEIDERINEYVEKGKEGINNEAEKN